MAIPVLMTTEQVCELIKIKSGTWRARVSRGQAPKPDGYYDERTPFWTARTIFDYARSNPEFWK